MSKQNIRYAPKIGETVTVSQMEADVKRPGEMRAGVPATLGVSRSVDSEVR